MPKEDDSLFPGSARDYRGAAKAEAEKVSTKIDKAFAKLAKKMAEKADKAKSKMEGTRKPEKRAVYLRRFELYADAATHLRERLPDIRD